MQRYFQLLEISKDLSSTLDLDTLLRNIVKSTANFLESQASSILLYDENSKELTFRAVTTLENDNLIRGVVIPHTSIAGWVVENRKPIIVKNVTKDSRYFGHVEKTLAIKVSNLLAVPLIARGKIVGVLEALNKISENFSIQDQDFLSALGSLAAIAIQNSLLFEQSDIVSELVHELRTPLTSINAIAYMMQRSEVSFEERKNLTSTIQSETNRLNDLLTSYLDLSRLESGRAPFTYTLFNLHVLIKECCDIVNPRAAQMGLTLLMSFPTAECVVHADVDKIKQVLLNLLSNAINYSKPAGKIIIQTWKTESSVFFSIQDNGNGISPEEIPHIFEKFRRSKSIETIVKGTGLGLSICKKIIDAHRGNITIDSKIGIGATFTVELPIAIKAI